MREDHGR